MITQAHIYGAQLTRSHIYYTSGSGPTPPTFEQTAVATVRKPVARVTITWSGPDIDNFEISGIDGTEGNGLMSGRPWLPRQVADTVVAVPQKWFHLDGTTLITDMRLAPSTEASARTKQVGWWGKDVAWSGGVFASPQRLQIRFSSSPIFALTLVGDSAYGEYAVDFSIEVFDGLNRVYSVSVTDNDSVTWTHTVASEILSASSFVLTITKWSREGTVAKVIECYSAYSTVYDGDEIVSLSILEEMEIREGSLPIGNISSNELDLELNNVDDKFFPGNTAATLHKSIRKNRKIFVELGFDILGRGLVYMPMGYYWSGDWRTDELGTTATTAARDRMELLRKTTFYPGVLYEDTSLYDLAKIVLQDALAKMPTMEYNISTELQADKYIVPKAWFKKTSHFDALRDIASACLGRVYVDRLGVVQVLGPQTAGASSRTIMSDNYFDRSQPANSEDVANRIEVTTQPLVAKELSTVYSSSEDISISSGEVIRITAMYSSPPVTDAVASIEYPDESAAVCTIQSVIHYAWGADIEIRGISSGFFSVKIDGVAYEIGGQEVIVATDADSQFEYGEQTYQFKSNHLVQTRELAQDIADSLIVVYKDPAKDIELSWRGNPALALADVFTAPQFVKGGVNNVADFIAYKQKIDFDGGLRASLSGRRVRTVTTVYQDADGADMTWQDTDNTSSKLQGW